jgi:hypothetical protein
VSSVAVVFALDGFLLRPGRSQAENPPDSTPAAQAASAPEIDPLSVNATCYVCHTLFVWEEISKQHLAEDITCIKCHGLSAGHANDEDVGATKPDIVYRRDQVDAMCRECHTEHDVPARDVIGRFLERKLTVSPTICTDCHGEHRIEAAEEEGREKEGGGRGGGREEVEPRSRRGAENSQ